MKLIIDLPELDYECAKQRWLRGNDVYQMDYYISKGIPFPKGMTNGDVLHTLFPDIEIYHCTEDGYDSYDLGDEATFDADWWNSSYQKDDE